MKQSLTILLFWYYNFKIKHMSYLLACLFCYAYGNKTGFIVLKLISVSREISTITARRSMFLSPSWKIRKDRNMANLPAIFLLSPRNPNPTIAERNTSFPLGAFYPYVMVLYFWYWTIHWIYLTYNACISYFITEGKFLWEVSGKLRSTWFRTEQSVFTCTSPSLIQDLNFKNFDHHFLYSAVHPV